MIHSDGRGKLSLTPSRLIGRYRVLAWLHEAEEMGWNKFPKEIIISLTKKYCIRVFFKAIRHDARCPVDSSFGHT